MSMPANTTSLSAAAMQRTAAEVAARFEARWRNAAGFEGHTVGSKMVKDAILALPAPSPAALLAEAVKQLDAWAREVEWKHFNEQELFLQHLRRAALAALPQETRHA